MVQHPARTSQLEALPAEVLAKVALNVVEMTFLGPPVDIKNLLLVSRTVHAKVHCSTFYAGVFHLKFDTGALKRRAPSWFTSSSLGDECRNRFTALKRIKAQEEFLVSDLWTAYLMMLESDGKNEEQLIEWAWIAPYLRTALFRKGLGGPTSPTWFVDIEGTSLLLSLIWLTSTKDLPALPGIKEIISTHFYHPFLMAGYRYPSWCGPSIHFDTSSVVSDAYHQPLLAGDGPLHRPSTITHYGHRLTLYPPSPTAGALMAWKEMNPPPPLNAPLPSVYNGLPANRAMAIAMGYVGPTQEDLREYDAQARIIPRARCFDVSSGRGIPPVSTSPSGSQLLDEEWQRALSCHDRRRASKNIFPGSVYRPGSLSGRWAGSFMVPEFQQYTQLIGQPEHDTSNVPFVVQGMFVDLQEHFCLKSKHILRHGCDRHGGQDVLNAWFPKDVRVQPDGTSIILSSPSTNQTTRYQSFPSLGFENADLDNSHAVPNPASNGDSTTDASFPSGKRATGKASHFANARDIIVTGESSPRHSAAWYHCKVLGRIRPMDGLIVLLVTFSKPAQTHTAPVKYIFRGYLYDRNFVGRWRETSSDLMVPGYGGPFFLSKVQHRQEAS